eukprot:gene10192-13710_t
MLVSSDIMEDKTYQSTYLLFLVDPELQKKYENFASTRAAFFIMYLTIGVYGSFGLSFLILSTAYAEKKCIFYNMIAVVFICNPIFIAIMYAKCFEQKRFTSNFVAVILKHQPFLENLTMIGNAFIISLALLGRVENGQCKNDSFVHIWSCNPEAESKALPNDTLFLLLCLPIVYSINLKAMRWLAVCTTWIFVVLAVAASIVFGGLHNSWSLLVMYIPISLLLIYENRRQYLEQFFTTEKLQTALEDNERLEKETRAAELRHMIGNVAHDLKTPLSGFQGGIDLILRIIDELKLKCNNSILTKLPTEDLKLSLTQSESDQSTGVIMSLPISPPINHNLRVLLVDDSFSILKITTMSLKKEGCIVTQAENGCSANSDDETVENALRAGIDDFIAKPFSMDTFYKTYDKIIQKKQYESISV